MSATTRTAQTAAGVDGWGPRRLRAAAVAVLTMTVALLMGLGYALYLLLAPPPDPTTTATPGDGAGASTAGQDAGRQRRDEIAAVPMLSVSPHAALPAPPATQTAPGILIPPATRSGAVGVPTGYPHTPEGAVGQLAAIETTVFQAMSMRLTAEVHRHWSLPGGETDGLHLDLGPAAGDQTPPTDGGVGGVADGVAGGVAGWEVTRHVQSFLGTAQMGPEKDVTATVTATPAAGIVKGSDGPDWVLACVLLDVRAVITTEARIGFGHCERMQWHDGRWLIAPGAPPARAPSTWPGSQASIDAGWRTWVDADVAPATDTSAGVPGPGPTTDMTLEAPPDTVPGAGAGAGAGARAGASAGAGGEG